jgi:hypothetical protein
MREYVYFLNELPDGGKKRFLERTMRFEPKFSWVNGPVFAIAIVNPQHILRDHAFTSMQEFQAVSVEAFFENPAGLEQSLPQLYGTLCDILTGIL